MAGHKIGPGIAEEEPHKAGAQFDVCLAISSFYIILAQVPKIMYGERDPQPDVPWGPEQASPGEPYEPEMQPKRMGTKEHTSSPDGHSKLSPSGSAHFRDQTRGRTSARAKLGGARVDVSDICGSASCSDLGHIACAARRLVRCSRRADGQTKLRSFIAKYRSEEHTSE